MRRSLFASSVVALLGTADSFVAPGPFSPRRAVVVPSGAGAVRLGAAASGGGKKKKRRRRRKKPIPDPESSVPAVPRGPTRSAPPAATDPAPTATGGVGGDGPAAPVDADIMAARAGFDLAADAPIGVEDAEMAPLDLPDIRETRQRKKEKEDQEAEESAKEEFKPKINRRDIEAMKKLFEVQPFADADDSFFEEEYDTVSALLSEKTKPFLGIAAGPLQVGHFIGALGIVLMAFIEYPGFPLTNLPTPLRDCLQTGLGAVYAINTVLSVFATFLAEERGQPKLLWAAKTFAVGGLAYDQITQLPTLKEVEKRKSIKGKRALGKGKIR